MNGPQILFNIGAIIASINCLPKDERDILIKEVIRFHNNLTDENERALLSAFVTFIHRGEKK